MNSVPATAGMIVRSRIVRLLVALVLVTAGLSLLAGRAAADPGLRADYQFQNSLTSSVAGAIALTNIGASNSFAAGGGVTFPAGGGLQLSPASSVMGSDGYTIALRFRFDGVGEYRRIIDFKNGTSDTGLYSRDGVLWFFNPLGGQGSQPTIAANAAVSVVLTRDAAGAVAGYVNGQPQFSFVDRDGRAVVDSSDTLRFFKDDGGENGSGTVTRIQLYDGALSASQVAGLDLGSGGASAGTPPVAAPSTQGAWVLVSEGMEDTSADSMHPCYPWGWGGGEGDVTIMQTICPAPQFGYPNQGTIVYRHQWTRPSATLVPGQPLSLTFTSTAVDLSEIMYCDCISYIGASIDGLMPIGARFDRDDIRYIHAYDPTGRVYTRTDTLDEVPESDWRDSAGRLAVRVEIHSPRLAYVYQYAWQGGALIPPTVSPAQFGAETVLFDNWNTGGVSSGPVAPTVFTLADPAMITSVNSYHWNSGRGTASPGSIALIGSDGSRYGPWQAAGSPGMGGVPNAYWTVQPNVVLPAGTYTVDDSDSATWSYNSASGGAGFSQVKGRPALP